MLEISTSGLMSGDGKRSGALQSTATAPVLNSTPDTSSRLLCTNPRQAFFRRAVKDFAKWHSTPKFPADREIHREFLNFGSDCG